MIWVFLLWPTIGVAAAIYYWTMDNSLSEMDVFDVFGVVIFSIMGPFAWYAFFLADDFSFRIHPKLHDMLAERDQKL